MQSYGGYASACIGLILIVWSILVIGGVQAVTIGEYRAWLAWGGVVLGVVLLACGGWKILGKR